VNIDPVTKQDLNDIDYPSTKFSITPRQFLWGILHLFSDKPRIQSNRSQQLKADWFLSVFGAMWDVSHSHAPDRGAVLEWLGDNPHLTYEEIKAKAQEIRGAIEVTEGATRPQVKTR